MPAASVIDAPEGSEIACGSLSLPAAVSLANTRSNLRRRHMQPGVVRTFFEEKHVQYAPAAG